MLNDRNMSRRSAIICCGSVVVGALAGSSIISPVFAGPLRDAVTNMAEKTYEDDIPNMSQDDINLFARVVTDVSVRVEQTNDECETHMIDTWDSTMSSSRSHVQVCPFCYSVAHYIETYVSGLTVVYNRIPKQFIINGIHYVAPNWGELHRVYGNGSIGEAEGYLWFTGGKYIGVGFNGVRLLATPVG